ncbi:hypothetical protein RHOSPDRAFT_30938 [Rhodotorula sp. JG-1b]|nr:hypothetical protein RHOSPDRAFT_30938 [Rhodotorula sp. JG-1b]
MQTVPVSLDLGVDRRAATLKPRASRTTHVSESSQPRSKPRDHAQPLPTLGQDAKGCSCGLISARGGLSGEDPSGGSGADAASVKSETLGARPRRRREAPVLRASSDSDVDDPDMREPEEEDDVGGAHLRSSEESLSPDSLAPSSLSTIRSRLFASDDEEEADDLDEEDEVGSALSSWSGWSPSSCFLPSASASSAASPPPPRRRASLSSTAATSDPLRHSFPSPPKLEFDRVRQRAHWLPAPSHPTAETAWSAPDVPDVVRSSLAASSSSPIHTPPNSPPRAASSSSPTRPESLLTKSLRSLSRLPNLTLADVLPRAASNNTTTTSVNDDVDDLAALPPGWGPAERRRVLAEEPSHAADEARAGFRYLLRRPPSPFSLTGRSRSSSSASSASATSSDFGGYPIDEVEALGYGFGFGLKDLGASSSSSSSSSERDPPSSCPAAAAASPPLVEDKVDVCVEAPTSPSADVPPLPPRPHEKRQVLVVPSHAADIPSGASTSAPASSPDQEAAASPPPSPPPPPPPLPPRFVSNHRHLLMLALEFEMMRHAKIRGPLRQRAVIVRQATSPPRERGAPRERSQLCQEVVEA